MMLIMAEQMAELACMNTETTIEAKEQHFGDLVEYKRQYTVKRFDVSFSMEEDRIREYKCPYCNEYVIIETIAKKERSHSILCKICSEKSQKDSFVGDLIGSLFGILVWLGFIIFLPIGLITGFPNDKVALIIAILILVVQIPLWIGVLLCVICSWLSNRKYRDIVEKGNYDDAIEQLSLEERFIPYTFNILNQSNNHYLFAQYNAPIFKHHFESYDEKDPFTILTEESTAEKRKSKRNDPYYNIASEAFRDEVTKYISKDRKLWGANLIRANLKMADLRGVDLEESKLDEADLKDAKLKGADFTRARLINVKNLKLEQLLEVKSLVSVIGLDIQLKRDVERIKPGLLYVNE